MIAIFISLAARYDEPRNVIRRENYVSAAASTGITIAIQSVWLAGWERRIEKNRKEPGLYGAI